MDRRALAHRLAAAARAETLPRRAAIAGIEDKGQGAYDPVTEADRAAERAMRALIEDAGDDGIAGEEFPDRPAAGHYVWSLDPIDGTRSFLCGLPVWTTLIALVEDGAPVLGLVDAPVLDELYVGDGTAATLNGAPIRTSGCTRLAEARLASTDPLMFSGPDAAAFARLRAASRVQRYGLDGYAYARLAGGGLDLILESGLKPFDWQAHVPLVRGAGGVIGNWQGGDDMRQGHILAAASRALFDEAVALLAR